MEAIRALAEEIGPRPACSPAEGRAARWCAARLADLGYLVEVETFVSRPSYAPWYAAYLSLSVAAALLIVPLPFAAAVLGTAALVLYARDAEGRPLIGPRGGTSHNVVARSQSEREPRIVVLAHMDSASASLSFHPRVVARLRASVVTLNLVLAAVPVAGASAWIAEAGGELPARLWLAAGLLAAYPAFAAALLVHSMIRMPVVAGANDNASGVEVLMRLADELRRDDIWFVVTGSEEAGMIGAQAFLREHGHEVGGARFLNVDNVGAGDVVAASDEGILRSRRADGRLLDAAEDAGAKVQPWRAFPTDGTVVMAHHLPVVTLIAVGPRGVPPNWHWPSDVLEGIDPDTLDAATAAGRAVVLAEVADRSVT